MRTGTILGLLAFGVALAANGIGCSSDPDDETNTTTSSTGDGGNTSSSSGLSSTSTSTSGTGGNGGGDGNDSFEEAEQVQIGQQFDASLTVEDWDYYQFTGQAGQALIFLTDAKPDSDPYADGYADLVITLFDSDQNQIAENDDPIPRDTQDSQLYTVLPETGTYYLRVGDFCYWSDVVHGSPCSPAQVIDNGAYAVRIDAIDFDDNGNVSESEGVMEYEPGSTDYYASLVQGTWTAASESDVYTFDVPDDSVLTVDCRHIAFFEVFPSGIEGSGSTAPTGNVWVSAHGSSEALALLDATKLDPTYGMTLQFPFDISTQYDLHVDIDGQPGTNAFYFLLHYAASSNPIEQNEGPTDEGANDDEASAETPALQTASSGAQVYWYSGDISTAGSDVDFFRMPIDALTGTPTHITGGCQAQRVGSGLRNLTFTLRHPTGTSGVLATVTEGANEDATLGDPGIAIPTSQTDEPLYMRVEAPNQASDVLGTHYTCWTVFYDNN